jgi:2-polyprenyl-6-hydroxyphenyl methylase/3-demethylubiquinone-9 3-methyltransferase
LWVVKTRLAFTVKGKSFAKMLKDYKAERGMDFYKDAHDWLGGYPYETISPAECHNFFEQRGFILIKQKIYTKGVSWSVSGGCDEYVFQKKVSD